MMGWDTATALSTRKPSPGTLPLDLRKYGRLSVPADQEQTSTGATVGVKDRPIESTWTIIVHYDAEAKEFKAPALHLLGW